MKLRLGILLILILSGCAGARPGDMDFSLEDAFLAEDLSSIPQDLLFFADKADTEYGPLLPAGSAEQKNAQSGRVEGQSGYDGVAAEQSGAMSRAIALFFSPWSQKAPAYSLNMAMGGVYWLNPSRGFIENLRPFPPERWVELLRNCDMPSYPNRSLPAITVEACDLRLMPTRSPYFFNPARPGQGYPFDYFQNSSLPLGTPVLVSHVSADGAWALVESPSAGGWVEVNQLALVDKKFMIEWRSRPLAAVTKENTMLRPYASPLAVTDQEPGPEDFLRSLPQEQSLPEMPGVASIGALLPYEPYPLNSLELEQGTRLLYYPQKGPGGMAVPRLAALPQDNVEPWPLRLTRRNIALLGNQMLGQPYGWGGYGGNRDCSATLRDLFLPFGLWLPRNSKAQAGVGDFIDLAPLKPEEKERQILDKGVPFLSLISQPGHITLYLGEYQGRAVMFHNMWGLRINRPGTDIPGRAIVGKAVITTLTPGKERADIANPASLLGSINQLSWPLGLKKEAQAQPLD